MAKRMRFQAAIERIIDLLYKDYNAKPPSYYAIWTWQDNRFALKVDEIIFDEIGDYETLIKWRTSMKPKRRKAI